MSRNASMESQLKTISVQGLLKLRNCADRLIAQKLRNARAPVREQLSKLDRASRPRHYGKNAERAPSPGHMPELI